MLSAHSDLEVFFLYVRLDDTNKFIKEPILAVRESALFFQDMVTVLSRYKIFHVQRSSR